MTIQKKIKKIARKIYLKNYNALDLQASEVCLKIQSITHVKSNL